MHESKAGHWQFEVEGRARTGAEKDEYNGARCDSLIFGLFKNRESRAREKRGKEGRGKGKRKEEGKGREGKRKGKGKGREGAYRR